jgi:hypothetical protein
MKKNIFLTLALTLVLGMAACGGSPSGTETSEATELPSGTQNSEDNSENNNDGDSEEGRLSGSYANEKAGSLFTFSGSNKVTAMDARGRMESGTYSISGDKIRFIFVEADESVEVSFAQEDGLIVISDVIFQKATQAQIDEITERGAVYCDKQTIEKLRIAIIMSEYRVRDSGGTTHPSSDDFRTRFNDGGKTLIELYPTVDAYSIALAAELEMGNASTATGADIANFLNDELRSRGATGAGIMVFYDIYQDNFPVAISGTDSTASNNPGPIPAVYTPPSNYNDRRRNPGSAGGNNIFADY